MIMRAINKRRLAAGDTETEPMSFRGRRVSPSAAFHVVEPTSLHRPSNHVSARRPIQESLHFLRFLSFNQNSRTKEPPKPAQMPELNQMKPPCFHPALPRRVSGTSCAQRRLEKPTFHSETKTFLCSLKMIMIRAFETPVLWMERQHTFITDHGSSIPP